MIRRLVFVASFLLVVACNKDKNDVADAAPEAAAPAAAADAAPEAEAPVASASASAVPLAVAPVPVAKPLPVDPPICAAARSAKARKSPAAINLEAQCKAAGGKL